MWYGKLKLSRPGAVPNVISTEGPATSLTREADSYATTLRSEELLQLS